MGDVALGAGDGQPAVAVLGRLLEQTDHGGRFGGEGEEGEVVVALGQAGLGEQQRLVGGAEAQRRGGPEARFGDHLVVATGAAGVVGEGDVVVAAFAHGVEGGFVQAAALPTEEAALDRLAGEVVVEAEDVGVGLDDQAGVDGGAQVLDERSLVEGGDGREEIERHPASQHRCGGHHRPNLWVEAVELTPHRLGDGPGERRAGELLGGEVAGAGDELLEEERVAASATVERVHGAVGRVVLEHRGEELVHLGRGEAAQLHVRDGVAPFEPRQEVGGGVAARQAVGSVGADEEEGAAAGLGEQLEHRQALGVGPVEVFEDHDAAGVGDEVLDESHRGAHPLLGGALGIGGDGVLLVGGDAVDAGDGIEEQLQRPAGGARVGLARQHDGAVRQVVDQLLDQAGLADAGLAGHQGDGGGGGGADQRAEAAELVGSADHHRRQTCAPHEHPLIVRVGQAARRSSSGLASADGTSADTAARIDRTTGLPRRAWREPRPRRCCLASWRRVPWRSATNALVMS